MWQNVPGTGCTFLESRSSKQLHNEYPWVLLSNTPAKCEVDQMNGCQENRLWNSLPQDIRASESLAIFHHPV